MAYLMGEHRQIMTFSVVEAGDEYVYNSTNALEPVSIFRNKDGRWEVVFTSNGKDVFPHDFHNFFEAYRTATDKVGLTDEN